MFLCKGRPEDLGPFALIGIAACCLLPAFSVPALCDRHRVAVSGHIPCFCQQSSGMGTWTLDFASSVRSPKGV